MKKFIEEHEKESLLILITMLAVTRWWIPGVAGFENMYAASQWALSYDYGLVRRGLIGTIAELWMPVVSIEGVHHSASVALCAFIAMLAAVFYFLLNYKEKSGKLFRIILFFIAAPATLSLCARDLGRFDLFLIIIVFLSLTILSFKKQLWLIPVLMTAAMFIHESFLVLYTPTIIAAMVFVYASEKREKKVLAAAFVSAISVLAAFFVLFKFGYPKAGYEEFSRLVQSRAAFQMTELSMRECYYTVKDHLGLTLPYLRDTGSILNFTGALVILSPAFLILLNLWTHALRNCKEYDEVPHPDPPIQGEGMSPLPLQGGKSERVPVKTQTLTLRTAAACVLFLLATLSGLMLLPIATDYGRWLSAIIFCNFFSVFFLISRDVIKVEELAEYSGGSFPMLFVLIVLTYLFFGPLHDWEPYPYQHNVMYSFLSITSVLIFDAGFILRWRDVKKTELK